MKEMMKISDRFNLSKKLGQGTFSYIYEAYDKQLEKNVALKIEKKDKNKSILIFEYNVLKMLNGIFKYATHFSLGLSHVCSAYDFVKNSEQNLIVMDLLGNNLAKVRKCLEDNYNFKIAIQLLIEMLDSIEEVHERGFIHRDVKASNFVLSRDNKHVFIVDFGLAKKHLDDNKNPVPQRKKADFRGTVSFASLNAHNNIDLSRRDDLWSLYFVILDFLNEKLKWREQKEYTMDEVKNIKTECLNNPEEKLWFVTKDIIEVKNIYYHLKNMGYKDAPNYAYIRGQLRNILGRNIEIPPNIITGHTVPAPNSAALNGQRVGCGSISQFILQQQHQQAPFSVYNNFNGSKSITIGGPTAVSGQQNNQEFQTPERPQNHQRLLQLAAANGTLIQPGQANTPITPQNNQSLNDDGAFPKASPHHLVSQVSAPHQGVYNINFQHNYSQQLFQANLDPRSKHVLQIEQQPINNIQGTLSQRSNNGLQDKRSLLKRKNHNNIEQEIRQEEEKMQPLQYSIPTQSQTKKTKQVTKIEKKAATVKKRDNKKTQSQIKIIPDEEPVKLIDLIENQKQDLKNQNQVLQIPTNNVPIFQFSPSNANCVNQQISISQNFYLSPHFLLLLNENEKQLYSQAALGNNGLPNTYANPIPSNTAATSALLSRPNSGMNGASQFPQTEILNPQGMIPVSLHQQNNMYPKVAPNQTRQDLGGICNIKTTKQQKTNSSVEPILEEKINIEEHQTKLLIQSQNAKVKAHQEVQLIAEQFMNVQQSQFNKQQYHFSNNFSSMTTACRNSKRQQNQIVNAGNYLYDPLRIEVKKQPCFKIEKVHKVDTGHQTKRPIIKQQQQINHRPGQ